MDTLIDPRDGQSYRLVELDGRLWMAENLRFDAGPGSWIYDDDPVNLALLGRLYTWEVARLAAPPGWHLATDQEWRSLARAFGGCDTDAVDGGSAAYAALVTGGSSGFDAPLAGFRNAQIRNEYMYADDIGLYWSATELDRDPAGVWGYSFYGLTYCLQRFSFDKRDGRSCRCVQNAP